MEIYLIRHTTVEGAKGICYGQADIKLSCTSAVDIEYVKNKLGDVADAMIVSSPSKRCTSLSFCINSSEVIIDKRLMELNFGDWELKEWSSINQNQLNEWMNNFVYENCPNGESYEQLFKRVVECYDELLKKDTQRIVIITHAGVIRSILSHVLSIPLEKSFGLKIDYGSISKITFKEQIISVDYINR